MVDPSEIRCLSPSILFFFAPLWVFLGYSNGHCPPLEGFVYGDSNLGVMLADLYPLLHQSLNWFQGMSKEERVTSEVRSSELEMGLSSSDDPVKVENDTATSVPLSSLSPR